MFLVSPENKNIKIYLVLYKGDICIHDNIIYIFDGFDDILSLFCSINRRAAGFEFLHVIRVLDGHNEAVTQSFCLPEKFNMPDVN